MKLFEEIKKCFPEPIENALFPHDRRMKWIEENGIEGLSSENIRFVINEVVRLVHQEQMGDYNNYIGKYLEVGSYRGCSFISALLGNEDRMDFFTIDNGSEFGDNNEILNSNIQKYVFDATIDIDYVSHVVNVIRGDYRTEIPQRFLLGPCIDVYLYDGSHDYQNQLDGLNIIKPYLTARCVIIVDDAAWPEPHRANMDWHKENLDFQTCFISHYTPEEWEAASQADKEQLVNNEYWWNGLRLFYRGFDQE